MNLSSLAVIAGVAVAAAGLSAAELPSSDAIRDILKARVAVQKQATGIVAGVSDGSSPRVVAYGTGDAQDIDGTTLFEIGSITKVFTSVLLADMVLKGEVALTDPVQKYLPEGTHVPERNGKVITLIDLATHTSGLPRLPDNLKPSRPDDPYADYTIEQLNAFLGKLVLTRDIGEKYEYSNLGAGLLGLALAHRAGKSYEALVRERITGPLGMTDTAITLGPELQKRMTPGHNEKLQPVSEWHIPLFAGAGALRSDCIDMMKFMEANLLAARNAREQKKNPPLLAAMAFTLTQRRPTSVPNLEIAMGWHIVKAHGQEYVWHNGGTGGYRSFVGFNPEQGTATVVLSNTSTATGVDDLGRHLLDAEAPLLKLDAPKDHKEITVDPKVLSRYVGKYQLAPNVFFVVTLENGRLFAQLASQPKFEVFAETETDFFYKVVNAQLTFEVDGDHPAPALVLHQNGQNPRAARVRD